MAGLYPLSRQIQFDASGNVAPGARLHLYDGGTSTPRTGYRDLALTSEHPNPILADSAGRLPLIYLDDGYYRQRLSTSTGEAIFDDDGIPVLTTSAGGAGTSVDANAILNEGNILLDFGTGAKDGFVRANGRTIGSATSGATERANSDTEELYSKLWAFDNISVAGGKGASAAADFAANKALTLPNAQGAFLAGIPDMGGTADSAFAALLTGTTTHPNATGGADTVTIAQANLPSYNLTSGTVVATGTTSGQSQTHTHAVIGSTGTESNSHTHAYDKPNGSTAVASGVGAAPQQAVDGSFNTGAASATHTHDLAITSGNASADHTHTVTTNSSSISIASGGSGTALNKLPSLLTVTVYIRL